MSPPATSSRSSMDDQNERTSLLSRHSDPEIADNVDNHRIDPLHQRSAWRYRGLLLALLALSWFWLALLSVDQLISVGVGATQGSGFECFVVSLIGQTSLLLSLLFYRAPSPSDRTLSLLLAALLFMCMLVISMVEQLRRRIGPVPMLCSFGGAGLASVLSSFANPIVNHAEEIEESSHANTTGHRRSVLQWFGVLLSNIGRLLLLVLVGLLAINLIFDAADSHLQIGALVPVGGLPDGNNDGTFVHLACTPAGTDGPVVIIEAGETSGEDMHQWVQRAQGLKAVCYWDRPGFGLSDNAPSPIGMEAVVAYLLSALEQEMPSLKQERIVLLSHGVGGLYSRVFANKIADQLAGLVLVDTLHEQQFYADQTAMHGLREFFRGVWAPLSIAKLRGVIQGLNVEERLFGRLAYAQPRLHKALLQQQISASRRTQLDIALATSSLPKNVPVLVISSAEMCEDKQWNRLQRLLLKLTDRVVAWKILDGPHNLWWNKRAEKELIQQLEAFVAYVKQPNATTYDADGVVSAD